MKDEGQAINISVESLRNRITGRLIPLLFIALLVSLLLSLARIPTIGFRPFMLLQILFLGMSATLYFTRKHIHPDISALVMLGILFSLLIAGVASLGLLSTTFVLGPIIALYLMLLGHRKSAYISIAVILLYLSVMAVLFVTGILSSVAIPNLYSQSSTAWILMLLVVGSVSVAAVSPFELVHDALQESEERFRLAFENTNIGACLTSLEGRLLKVNNALCEMLGYTREELEQMSVSDITHQDDKSLSLNLIEHAQRGGEEKINLDKRYIRKLGDIIWANVSSSLIRDSNRNPQYFITHIRNITEGKHGEEMLKQALEWQEAIFEGSRDSIFISDQSSQFVAVNSAACELTGYSREQLLKMRIPDLHDQPDLVAYKTYSHKIFDGEEIMSEAKILRHNGSKVDTEFNNRRVSISGVYYMHTTARDITERKRAEGDLKKSEELYRTVFENTGTATVLIEENSIIGLANAEFEKLSQYSKQEIEGEKSWTEFVVKENLDWMRIQHQLRRENHEAALKQYEFGFVRRDGSIRNILVTNDIIPGTKRSIASLLDITERNRTEEALQQSEKRSRVLSDAAFEGIMIHDRGVILDANQAFADLFGFGRPEDLIGLNGFEVLPFTPESLERLKKSSALNSTEVIEISVMKPNGVISFAETQARNFITEEGKLRVVSMRDITQRKRADQERQAMYEIVEGVTTTANLDELFKLIHRSLGKVLYAENCFIALHDSNTGLFNFPYFVDKFDSTPEPAALLKSCTSYVFRSGKPHRIPQAMFDKLLEQNEVELVGSPSPSWIGVPLNTPAKTIGVLVLQHYEKENIYSEHDLRFLASVGSEVALVIERKLAEEALRKSEERMRAIVEGTPHLFFYTQDAEANTTYVSPTVEQITGHNVDMWLKRKDWFTTDAKINQSAKEKTYAHLQGELAKDPTLIEVRHANGDPILLEAYEYPIMQNGKVIGLQGVAHDVTERKLAEDSLRESESRFRQLAEAAVEGIAITERGIFVDGNARVGEMLGYALGEMAGRPVADFIAPDSRSLVLAHIRENYEGSYEHLLLRKDGSTFPVESHARTMMWKGRLMRVTVLLDVSERTRAEGQLQKLSLAVGQSPASIVITDTKGNIEYVNPKFTQVTGYTLEEAIGKNPSILKSGET
ncbi:MAG: PAS domain S-box protein, partial [Bacteroidota bacterium]